ncbi:hypothetical protein QJQ45_001706 [Haematococcus lacustris]|nr:hypothetical protein QJQ45_001704 [Haematococcus lacustris]KAJ9509249.1 hypothetical protein QJQ45_001706 [Haematococcus lacustris]
MDQEAARPDRSPAQVDVVVAEVNKRMTMGSKQCVLAAVLCLFVLLQSFLGKPPPGFPAAGPAPGPHPPPDPACPPYAHPRLATRSSPRDAAAPAQLPPPVQLNIWDPQLLAQIKDAMELLTKASVLEHLMRGPHHRGIRLLPGEVAVFEQPSSAWLVAMLKELNEVHLLGDLNSLNANATKIITNIQEYYRHPGRFISWWCKAVGVVQRGFSRAMRKHFPQMVLGRLDCSLPDREDKWRLLRQPRWVAEMAKHRRLLRLPAQWREGMDSIGKGGAGRLPLEKRVRHALFVNRNSEGWQTPHGTCPRPFTMLPMVGVQARHFVIDDRVLHGLLTDLGITDLTRLQFASLPLKACPIGRSSSSTASCRTAWEWKLSKGQLKHDSGLTKAKQDTARWSTAIQPQLLQLAAATPAGTTLGGLQAHILALKATWDAQWEEYLKPRWRKQRLALHHAQDRVIEHFCKKQPSRPSTDPRPDRLVIVDEFRTSRVSSSVHARQPCELHLPPDQPRPANWVPPAGQVNPRLVRPAWSLRHAKYVRGLSWCHQVPPNPPPAQAPPAQAPSPPPAQAQTLPAAPGPVQRPQAPPGGRWLDRDTNGCLNMQRIGESMQRPIELCQWKDLEALPPNGEEYQQRYKLVNDPRSGSGCTGLQSTSEALMAGPATMHRAW